MIQSLPSESTQTASNHLTTDNHQARFALGQRVEDRGVVAPRDDRRFLKMSPVEALAQLLLERSAFRLTHILSSSDSWRILVVEWP
jgi:hypothetical protein